MITWIMTCVSTTSFSVSINGVSSGYFRGGGGLRQGDPIKLKITNVCSADDLLTFCHADIAFVSILKDAIEEFRRIAIEKLPIKYLGVPITSKRLGIKECKSLTDKVENRVTNWKNKSLTYVGRLMFVASVSIGTLDQFISNRDMYDERLCTKMTVSEMMGQSNWSWPAGWTSRFPILLSIHLNEHDNDRFLWKNKEGKFSNFSVKQTYNDLLADELDIEWWKVFSIWKAFGGNTRDLGSFGEETDKITNQHQDSSRFKVSEPGDGVTIYTRRHHTSSSDGVTTSLDGVNMDDPNITMEEYIRLEEEKSRRRGKVFNLETAKYGKIWYDEDVHDLISVEIEFPAIAFNDENSFDDSHDEDYTVIFDKSSFSYKKISNNDLKTNSENDNEKVMLSLPSPEPAISCFDDLYFLKEFENEFSAIVYNNAQTSKSDLLTEPILNPQHIDEFNLKDETSLSECDEDEQNVLNFNDLFPFNVIYPNDSKSEKDNDDDKVDIEHSLGDLSVKPLPDIINTDTVYTAYPNPMDMAN
ncbi:hypothetical protein Tco_0738139 [Tanacetum coccineum]